MKLYGGIGVVCLVIIAGNHATATKSFFAKNYAAWVTQTVLMRIIHKLLFHSRLRLELGRNNHTFGSQFTKVIGARPCAVVV